MQKKYKNTALNYELNLYTKAGKWFKYFVF